MTNCQTCKILFTTSHIVRAYVVRRVDKSCFNDLMYPWKNLVSATARRFPTQTNTENSETMKTLRTLLTLALCFTFCLSFTGLHAEEASKTKFTAGKSVTVKTKLGTGRFATIMQALKDKGIKATRINHGTKDDEVTIRYLTYSDSDTNNKSVTADQVIDDLRASGYRAANIEELASIDDGNSGLDKGQQAVSFGSILFLTLTECRMFAVSIKDGQFALNILETEPKTQWDKKGLLIPAVLVKPQE